MSYIGIPDDTVKKLAIEAMRHEQSDTKFEKKKFIKFNKTELPKGSKKLENWLEKYNTLSTIEKNNIDNLITYLTSRGIGPDWYDFMYSDSTYWDTNKRVLITVQLQDCTALSVPHRTRHRTAPVCLFAGSRPDYSLLAREVPIFTFSLTKNEVANTL